LNEHFLRFSQKEADAAVKIRQEFAEFDIVRCLIELQLRDLPQVGLDTFQSGVVCIPGNEVLLGLLNFFQDNIFGLGEPERAGLH
jgi:hypothetical protein